MNNKKPTINEILNFDFSKELDIKSLPLDEQENFNSNLFGNLMERIVKRTTENFSEEHQDKIIKMIESEKTMESIFQFIAEKNEDFIEEAGEEFLEFKSEIYNLLKNN